MALLYRRYRAFVGLFIAAVLGWGLYAGFTDLPETESMTVCFYGTLAFLIVFILLARRAVTLYKNAVKKLDEDCDPEGFLKESREPFDISRRLKKAKKLNDLNKLAVMLNYAVALDSKGDAEEAIKLTEHIASIEPKKRLMRKSQMKVIFEAQRAMMNVNLASMLIRRGQPGDEEKAREYIEKAKQSPSAAQYILRTQYMADVLAGNNLESARDFFTRSAESEPTKREKIYSMYYAGLAADKLGDTEAARGFMEKAAQGGGLITAKKAAEWLNNHSED